LARIYQSINSPQVCQGVEKRIFRIAQILFYQAFQLS
jgi:hypothetical protein